MLSVIVCTYNRSESLRVTLGSLVQLSAPFGISSWELIVVDNNSTDDTAAVVKAFAATASLDVHYVFEANQGLSHARNAGIRAARGDMIAFTDDDVTVDTHWLQELVKVFDRFDCIGVGGRIIVRWDRQKPLWLDLDGPQAVRRGALVSFDFGEDICELNHAPFGANMAFKKAAFERYGFFRTDLGRQGNNLMVGEDSEFGARLLRAGEKLVYAPSAIVYHPVPKVRLKKGYFQSHYFHYGKSTARMNGFPESTVLWFGVPRYLFRTLATQLYKWILTFDSRRRFRRKLDVCECLGEISGARNLSVGGK